MAVTLYRMRSGKVHSFSRLAYGIENNTLLPAVCSADGGKRRYWFSDKGVGVYPILITGDSSREIISYLSQASGVRFTIRGSQIENDDDEYAADWERAAHRPKSEMEGFTIHCKWHSWKKTDKAIEIHDAGMDIFKTLAITFAGWLGGGIQEGLKAGAPPMPPKLPTAEEAVVEAIKGASGSAPDVYDIGKTLSGGGGGAGKGRRLGILVHYLPLNGGRDTGRRNIAARQLARIADRMWPQ